MLHKKKFNKKNILINSFFLAFTLSFISIFFIYPQLDDALYTNIIGGGISLTSSGWFFAKVFFVLSGQTSILGGFFYVVAKKLFLHK